MEIADLDGVAPWLGLDPQDLRMEPLAFKDRFGTYVASWPTTRQVAMRVAQVLGGDVLKAMAEHKKR